MRRWSAILAVPLIILMVGLVYSYRQVDVQLEQIISVRPKLTLDLGSAFSAVFSLFAGDTREASLEALPALVDGVQVDALVAIRNEGFLPIYIPRSEHAITLGGQRNQRQTDTLPDMWLMPDESRLLPVGMLVPLEEILPAALDVIVEGGEVEVNVRSTAWLLFWPVTFNNQAIYSVVDSLRNLIGNGG